MRLKTTTFSILFALILIPAVAFGQSLTLQTPILGGASTVVSGTGAWSGASAPGNQVELFVNGGSRGIVLADQVAGTFSFPPTALNGSDEVYANLMETWYFDNDGDLEGWADNNADSTSTVSGGVLTLTVNNGAGFTQLQNVTLGHDAAGNQGGTPANPSGVGHPCDWMKVLEIRLRNNGTANVIQVGVNTGSGVVYQAMNLTQNMTGFETYVWPLLGNHPGYLAGATNFWLLLAPQGATTGDTIEIDYIRVREYLDYHFDNDLMNWVVNFNLAGGISVSNGFLTGTASGTGWADPDRIATFHPFANIDHTVFDVWEVATNSTGAGITGDSFDWSDGDGIGFPNNDVLPYTVSGGIDVITHFLSGNAEWSNNPPVFNTFLYFIGGQVAGDTLSIDYMRLRPSGVLFGPSAVAEVEGLTDVNQWEIYR